MGYSYRIFAVNDDDSLQRISNARFERFFRKTERLTKYAGKRLRYAFVIVKVVGHKVLDILRIDYSILPLDRKGGLDEAEWDREMRFATETISSILYPEEPTEGNVINARAIFARKEHDASFRWKPSADMELKIYNAIFSTKPNRRAPKKRRLKLVK